MSCSSVHGINCDLFCFSAFLVHLYDSRKEERCQCREKNGKVSSTNTQTQLRTKMSSYEKSLKDLGISSHPLLAYGIDGGFSFLQSANWTRKKNDKRTLALVYRYLSFLLG